MKILFVGGAQLILVLTLAGLACGCEDIQAFFRALRGNFIPRFWDSHDSSPAMPGMRSSLR